MERTASGKWTLVAATETIADPIRPKQRQTLDPFVATSPDPQDDAAITRRAHRLRVAERSLDAPVAQQRADQDRRTYYLRRADEAQVMAEAAPDPRIKLIHLEMAARYYSLANYHLDQFGPLSAVG